MSADIIQFPGNEPSGPDYAADMAVRLEKHSAEMQEATARRPPPLTDAELTKLRRIMSEHDLVCTECPVARRIVMQLD